MFVSHWKTLKVRELRVRSILDQRFPKCGSGMSIIWELENLRNTNSQPLLDQKLQSWGPAIWVISSPPVTQMHITGRTPLTSSVLMDSLLSDEDSKAWSKSVAFPLSPGWMCKLEKKMKIWKCYTLCFKRRSVLKNIFFPKDEERIDATSSKPAFWFVKCELNVHHSE